MIKPESETLAAMRIPSVGGEQQATGTLKPIPATTQQVNGPAFVLSCLLLPVIWGVLIHMIFNKLRRNRRPAKLSESGWPDYQI